MKILYFLLFSLNITQKKDFHEKLMELLSFNNFLSQDMAYEQFTKNFFNIIYMYPNFILNQTLSYNYYDILNEINNKSIDEQFIDGFIKQRFLEVIFNNIISIILRFSNLKDLIDDNENKNNSLLQRKYGNYLGLFIDNWLMDDFNKDEFFQWVSYIQQKYDQDDYIYIYLTIINNDYDILLNIYKEVNNNKNFLDFKHHCIFYNLLQGSYQGQYNEIFLYKVTYPLRPNYVIFQEYFKQTDFYKPYQYCHRWVLTKISQKIKVKDISLKNLLIETNKIHFKKNLKILDENLVNIILFYFFIKSVNGENSQYEQYCYWFLVKYYGSYYYNKNQQTLIENLKQKS